MTAPRTDAGTRELDGLGQVCRIEPTWCLDVRAPVAGEALGPPSAACAFAGCAGWIGGAGSGVGSLSAPAVEPLQGVTAPPSAVVPLPGAAVLLATGLVAVMVMRKTRRK